MDPDVFPNSIEYWGPPGMVYFLNVQFRWMPMQGDTNLTLALEQPGASGDAGRFADRIELQNIQARFPLPDLTGQFTYGRKWGYVRAAGALRRLNWDDTLDDAFDLSGSATGWGVNLSSNVNIGAEEQKGGCAIADLPALLAEARGAELPVVGLMCVPPAGIEAAPFFALLDKLAADHGLPGRSMGMSDDFETAIMLGATHVRVGSALFGARE